MKNFHFFKLKPELLLCRQGSIAECGLACMTMILNYHGFKTDLHTLRRKYPVAIEGTSFYDLKKMSETYRLNSVGLRINLSQLALIKRPVIIQIENNHFVVFKKIVGENVVIFDPAIGVRKIELPTFKTIFSGHALACSPKENFEKKVEISKINWTELFPINNDLLKIFGHIFALSILIELAINCIPIFSQRIIDDVIPNQNWKLIEVLFIGFLTIITFHGAFVAIRSVLSAHLSININQYMQSKVFDHLLRLPLAYFEQRNIGDIQSRFMASHQIRAIVSGGIISTLIDAIMGIIVVVIMLNLNPFLSFISLTFILIYIIIRWVRYYSFKEYVQSSTIEQAELDSYFLESIRGVSGIKIYNIIDERVEQWSTMLNHLGSRQLKNGIKETKFSALAEWVCKLEFGVSLFLGAQIVLSQDLSLGYFLAFLSFKDQFFWRLRSLTERILGVSMIGVSFERLKDILCNNVDELSTNGDIQKQISYHVNVDNVSYRYSAFTKHILENLTITVNSGEHLVITGRSGIGKSTLAKILLGLIEPEKGSVFIGGLPLSDTKHLVKGILQGDRLYSGSILENITMFSKSIDIDRVQQCAKAADIHDDITSLKMRYESLVGDMGSSLSGGQVQRILIARALYGKPKVLILDEATSNLDEATEKNVARNIAKLGITIISISHRKTTIDSADKRFQIQG